MLIGDCQVFTILSLYVDKISAEITKIMLQLLGIIYIFK